MKATLASIFALFAAACTQTPAPSSGQAPEDVSNPPGSVATADGGSMALFARLDREAGKVDNVFVSPVSIEQAFGLLHAGTAGETRIQLEGFFGWPAGDATERRLEQQREELLGHDTDADIRLANALWLSQDYRFRQEYLQTAERRYAATAERMDFAGDPAGSAKRINGWAADKTAGLIDEIVNTDALADDTAALLTNALYFEAEWKEMFDGAEQAPFLFGDGHEEDFRLMTQTEPFATVDRGDWRAVRMPYRGDRFTMDVVMPKQRRAMDAAPAAADLAALAGALDDAVPRPVELWLPRFEIDFDSGLVGPLERIGLTLPFDMARADLSAMAEPNQRSLFVKDATHITKLQVYEDGTKAAAVTVLRIMPTAARVPTVEPVPFKVDRPFVAIIRDLETGQVLFIGRIAAPQVFEPEKGEDMP